MSQQACKGVFLSFQEQRRLDVAHQVLRAEIRLIPELRIKGINRIPAANEFITLSFVPEFDRR